MLFYEVKAADIMEKSVGGSVFFIIDCPSEYYLKQMQRSPVLASHEEGGKGSTPVIIIHLSPAQVVQTQEYKVWTER